jgi:hypothetical protein
MSHIVQIQTQVNDPEAIRAACRRLQLPEPTQGTARLFSGEAAGWLVQLAGWQYPVVFDTQRGEARFDNFSEHWGKDAELHKFLQAYACERAKLEARRQGHSVAEQVLENGSIKLTIQVRGSE